MASTDRQRWARVVPGTGGKRPGLPTDWVRVLDQHPEGAVALPGHVWLGTPHKVLHVDGHVLEFTDMLPEWARHSH